MATKQQSDDILSYPSTLEKVDYSQRDNIEFYDYAQKHLALFEGTIQHPYLDTEGEVTVGIGHLVKTRQDMVPLNFVYRQPPAPPLPQKPGEKEKKEEWKRVKDLLPRIKKTMLQKDERFPRAENTIFSTSNFILEKHEITTLFISDFTVRLKEIRKIFKRFDKFPDPAKLGIIDLYYNVGSGTFRDFIKFKNAVLNEDWQTAGKESVGKRPNQDRINRSIQLFEEAYQIKNRIDRGTDKFRPPTNGDQKKLLAEKDYNDVWQS